MMSAAIAPSWVVLKFGGTSVSTLANWYNIAAVVRERSANGTRLLIVHSAVTGVTDRLETLLGAALVAEHAPLIKALEERHRALAAELELGESAQLEQLFADLQQMIASIARMGEISDRTRARVMACGELMATELGARFLNAQGIPCTWWDARDGLHAELRANASVTANYQIGRAHV